MRHHNHQNPVARPDASMASERPKNDSRKYGHPTDYHAWRDGNGVRKRSTNRKRRQRDRKEAA